MPEMRSIGYYNPYTQSFQDEPYSILNYTPMAGDHVHRAILQRLNRKIDGVCMRYSTFARNPADWTAATLLFGNDHPDMARFDLNADQEMARIDARVCGSILNPEVIRQGIPSLQADVFIRDQEVHELILQGKIGISTGFRMKGDQIKPHHVLLFIEDAVNLPRDLGTGFIS